MLGERNNVRVGLHQPTWPVCQPHPCLGRLPQLQLLILLPYSVPVRMAECLSLATCTLRGHAIDRWWMHEVVGVLWVRDVTNVLSLVIQPKLS